MNNFTAIANKIIPKTFFKISIPPSPSMLSIFLLKRKTMYTIKMLIKIVLFKRIIKINDNQFYWINYNKIDNSLLSSFSKKFIELVKIEKFKYV